MVNFILKSPSGFSETLLNVTKVRCYLSSKGGVEIYDNHQEMMGWIETYSVIEVIDKELRKLIYLVGEGTLIVENKNITQDGNISDKLPVSTCAFISAEYAHEISGENARKELEEALTNVKAEIKNTQENAKDNVGKIEILEKNEAFLTKALMYVNRGIN